MGQFMAQVIPNMTNMPTTKNRVFIDTNVFVALRDKSDSTHDRAKLVLDRLTKSGTTFFTSSEVIGETLTVISRKLGKKHAVEFLLEVGDMVKEIFVDENLHKISRSFFNEVKSKNVSFVDCSNVIVMKNNRIKAILSFDEDFKKLGVKLAE